MNKKVLFILLTLALALTLVPAFTRASHAASSGSTIDVGDSSTAGGTNWAYASGVFTVYGDVTITGTTTANRVRVVVTSGTTANITLNGVNIDVSAINYTAFDMSGATVNLTLQGTNTLKSGMNGAGINVPTGAALTISGSGTVYAIGGSYVAGGGGAGIGGSGGTINNGGDGGAVTINGGTVNATGGGYYGGGAGIGGSGGTMNNGGSGGTLTINGGTVNATGGSGAGGGAGIGGGGSSMSSGGSGGTLTINGGTVNATGGSGAGGGAGIGGGGSMSSGGGGGTLTITGGSVRRTGGTMSNEATATNDANGANSNVYMTTLMVGSPAVSNSAITAGSIGGVDCSSTPNATTSIYGIKDVKTDGEGKLYFWLPANGAKSVVMTTGGAAYSGSVTPNTSGTEAVTLIADTTAPILSGGSATRTSDIAATIGFTTDEAGKVYYLVVEKGATAPDKATVKAGTSLGSVAAGAASGLSVTLTAGAKDIYVVVEDAAGNISEPLKIEAAVTLIADTIAPIISGGSATRASDTAAVIGFTTNEAGTAYYLVVESGATAPDKTTVKAGTSLGSVATSAASGLSVTLTAGAKDIYVVVEDAAGNISEPLKIEAAAYALAPAPVAPTITTTVLASGTVGVAYSQTLAATGDAPITWSLNGGSLPSGLTLSSAGAISGNPTAAGAFAFTVKALNGVNPDATKNFSITIAAAPPTLDPLNNVTIGNVSTNLGDNASGTGWTWNALTKTLALTGDLKSEIKIASETTEITVRVANNVNVPKIIKKGNGSLKITGAAGKTLSVSNTNGPAISSEGDIYIDSGTVKANVTGAGNTEPAIKAGRNITITGTANVVASNSGTGANSGGIVSGGKTTISTTGGVNITSTGAADAINATGGVEITNGVNIIEALGGGNAINTDNVKITGGANTIEASGGGHAINANNGNGTISITGGHTEITDQGSGTNPYPPAMSGVDTVVIVNGQIIFGKPVTPDNPDYDDKRRSSGGCDAGVGVFALALLPLACMGMKRKEK
ncbi:hypothetical protein AGMMS50276_12800 [Synergistales bacterium]|nr:hypothetical protein AGMMS50276_12800 [Synergistales bacterium]